MFVRAARVLRIPGRCGQHSMPNHSFVAAVIPGVEILVASQSSGLCSPHSGFTNCSVLSSAFCIHASFLPLELQTEADLSHLMKVAQLYPTLCKPVDYTVHGILQARILEWVAVPFSRGSSQPRDRTQVS